MVVYAIADLHLSFGVNKPMDIFGGKWINYEEKLKKNWNENVKEDDVVIIPGDISWATYLDQAVEDFQYINELAGKKIILKGNHDYWWETVKKMNEFLEKHEFFTIEFLYNNSIELEHCILCGTKGYGFDEKDKKIINREIERFKLSLQSIKNHDKEIIAIFHYPPTHSEELLTIIKEHNIKKVIYGHIHGEQTKTIKDDEIFSLVSADYLHFKPVKISK
ncbi:MAG: metallophosphoesterase [Clostridiales bacterium]|nr:metallophosphoesterase [Clostridiales bacterium]